MDSHALSYIAKRYAIKPMYREQILGCIEDLFQAFGALLCLAATLTLPIFIHRAKPFVSGGHRWMSCRNFPICVVGTQLVLVYLPRRGQRHGVNSHNLVGNPPSGHLAAK